MTAVTTDRDWQITLTSANRGSLDAARYELRRHMSLAFEDALPQSGGLYAAYRVGRPYRDWSTSELSAMLARNPIIIRKGVPVRVTASQTVDVANVTDAQIAAAREGASQSTLSYAAERAGELARGAARTGGEILGAVGGGVAVGAGAALLGPILLALSGLVLLYIFRVPLLRGAKQVLR